MSDLLDKAIHTVSQSPQSFFHFIVANEVGATGSHQRGLYLSKGIAPYLFEEKIFKGVNFDRKVKIRWQDEFETNSRLIYYGKETRNEFRMTQFGKSFPFLCDELIGSMIIFSRISDTEYKAYVLNTEEDIENFLLYYRLSPNDTNKFILSERRDSLKNEVERVLGDTNTFIETQTMGLMAREAWSHINPNVSVLNKPDEVLMGWFQSEEILFKILENRVYHNQLSQPFYTCEAAANFANAMLNRRKSRAGKSLEHHLATIFTLHNLRFEEQVRTEGKKRPDFIFPDGESYHDINFPSDKLVFLGAKTTCKDRWRQVLNEADRIEEKYLFTLQPGVSSDQLKEMKAEHLHLVIPRSNLSFFPTEHRSSILSLSNFIDVVKMTQI